MSGPADGRPRLPRRVALRKALPAGLLLLPLALGVATLLGGGASAAPADEAAAARAALGELKSSEQSALSELTSVSAKLEAARTYEAELAAKVERQRAALADKRRELASVRKNQAAAQELLTERLQYWYRTGGVDIVEVVLGASSIDEALGQIDALRRISSQDARIVGETRDAAAKARRAAADLARVEAELEQAQKDAAQDAQWLASVQSEKQALVARLRREQGLTAQRIDRLEAAAAAAAAAAEDEAPAPADDGGSGGGGNGGGSGNGGGGSGDDGGGAGNDGGGSGNDGGGSGNDGGNGGNGGGPGGGRTMQAEVTAYTDGGLTASGHPTGPGVCATDTSVIPHYTEFYVPGYGWCTSYDTGGAIIGNIIDIWVPTEDQAYAWGRRYVTITFR